MTPKTEKNFQKKCSRTYAVDKIGYVFVVIFLLEIHFWTASCLETTAAMPNNELKNCSTIGNEEMTTDPTYLNTTYLELRNLSTTTTTTTTTNFTTGNATAADKHKRIVNKQQLFLMWLLIFCSIGVVLVILFVETMQIVNWCLGRNEIPEVPDAFFKFAEKTTSV